ncbi:CRP-like cAMP-binding protein [Anaerobacterium chartisolvens]|uniref:CRP-like cAMP-binding protein n=1 Tax=Anaerobacterium chartisolvens TaxID=1297424 RepID=A0A369BHK9_9FIRM|nr:Crp/Fnr family transcriptional regulator [Anaerobacterium chartisolvens]RCX21052.1 CRP-like cAMP-binding protein [Anaerobacterium chartisolvens]
MIDKYREVLCRVSLFNGISHCDLAVMLDCLKPKTCKYRKEEMIACADDPFESIGIILEGEAAVIKENAAGSRAMMTLLRPSDIFGEMAVFSGRPVWPASVVAKQTCAVLFIPRQNIVGECSQTCARHRTMIFNMLKIISEKALMLNKKVEYLSIKSMRGKLCTFIMEQYKRRGSLTFMLPMNRNELADFLNVSRPSMSRELCRLRDEGIIDFHLSSVRVLNVELLKSMAE